MANFFSLSTGPLLTDTTWGYSLSSAEIMNLTSSVWLSTVDAYGPSFAFGGNTTGLTINAIAVHLSSRVSNPTSETLTLKLSSGATIITENYNISGFTSYNGSNNLLTPYSQNWQILKLSNPYTFGGNTSGKISLNTSSLSVLSLMGNAVNNNYEKVILRSVGTNNPSPTDSYHIGGVLLSATLTPITVTVDTTPLINLYIHNGGTLNFPLTSSSTLTINGSAGLQITSDGTVNIGTSSQNIPLSTTHTIILSNTQIDVHNGGNLNVYGYPKAFTTNLVNDTVSASNTFTTVDNVSSIWKVGDILTFKPSLSFRTGFDTLTLSGFTSSNTFKTTTSSVYTHTGSATYAYIPAILNLSRNVKIQGLSPTNRGTIRTIDAANTSINYAQLSNFGINSVNKTGFVFGNNLSGSTTLSGVVINSDNTSTVNNIAPLTGRTFQNTIINNNIINKSNVVSLTSLSVNNVNISNNYILSSVKTGLEIINCTGSINMSNNTTIGSLSYGTYLSNNTLTGTYGASNYNSALQGMYISGTNTGTIVGGGLNSAKEGVYVDASTYNLSGATFQNILANNNSSVGFKISGNNLNYLTPVVLNVNGLTCNTNSDVGFEGYNITGNISSVIANNNYVNGIKTSIGNGPTIFDGLTSITSLPSYSYTTTGTQTISSNAPYNGLDALRYLRTTNNISFTLSTTTIGTSDFTIECWSYFTSVSGSGGYCIGQASNGINCWYIGQAYAGFYNGTVRLVVPYPSALSNNTWYHVALVRKNNSVNLFLNGVSGTAVTCNYDLNNITPIQLGYNLSTPTTELSDGYISNFRIVKRAIYTTNFTPPSASKLFAIPDTIALINDFNGYYTYTYGLYNNTIFNVNILSATNYNQTIIKNAYLSTTPIANYSINLSLNVNKLEEFRLENSSLTAATPLSLTTIRSVLEGSYLFHNSNSNVYNLSSLALTGYQSEVFLETGFTVMRENGLSGNHYRQLASGKISHDDTLRHNVSGFATEKLTPMSSSLKLRSGSKQIPLNLGDYYTIGVYIYKSASYSGTRPRLIMKRNPSLGYNSDTVLSTDSSAANGVWFKLSGYIPVSQGIGIVEIYVECSGAIGSGTINIDDWSLT